jgi:hypothetical protein
MIHLSINKDVAFLLDRYFYDDVLLASSHTFVAAFSLNDRIEVRIYEDFPMYLALFYVDQVPVIKEVLIDDTVAGYIEKALAQAVLPSFIFDYADARRDQFS